MKQVVGKRTMRRVVREKKDRFKINVVQDGRLFLINACSKINVA